ncbi:MAG TPA: MarR family transcriptional regulator [Thalassobaculum sp.]
MQVADQHRALNLWRLATVASVRGDGPYLTARQMAILLTAYLTPPPHTVRGLADAMGISKPAVTRALDRLGDLGFLRRRVDEADRRSVLVQRTVKGSVFLSEFAELVSDAERTLRDGGEPVEPV